MLQATSEIKKRITSPEFESRVQRAAMAVLQEFDQILHEERLPKMPSFDFQKQLNPPAWLVSTQPLVVR